MNYYTYKFNVEDHIHQFGLEFQYEVINYFDTNFNIKLETKDLEEFICDIETLNNIIKDIDANNFIRFGKSLITLFHNL